MSVVNTQKFPGPALWHEMLNALSAGEAEALKVLAQHRGFARTDEESYKEHRGQNPLVYLAINYNYTALLKALLEEGTSPNARDASYDPPHLLLQVLKHDLNEPGRLEQLEMLLAHPDCSYCYTMAPARDWRGTTTPGKKKLLALHGPELFDDNLSPDTLERRQRIFTRMLEMIPEEEKKPGNKFALQLFKHSINVCKNSTDDQNFMLREMVNHGFGLGKDYLLQDENPLQWGGGTDGKRKERFAATRAAGMQDDCFLWEIDSGSVTLGAYLESLFHNTTPEWKKFGEDVQARTREILDAEIEKIRSGDAEHILLTQKGRASWQAQGLAAQGMLAEALEADKLKGTAPEVRKRLIVRLEEALPPSLRHFFIPLLREETLAQPSSSALVKYVRGGVAEVAQRGGAA